MPLENVWIKTARPSVIAGEGTWTADIELPAQLVFASTSMQSYNFTIWTSEGVSPSGTQGFGAWSGVKSYKAGGTQHHVGQGQLGGVVPAVIAHDVDSVTFLWGIGAQPLEGGVANTSTADFTFQISGWGE
jgi:hypothetical protein